MTSQTPGVGSWVTHILAKTVGVYMLSPTCLQRAGQGRAPLMSALQVRQELQRLPGAPTQTSRLFCLHAKAADLKQQAADMEAKAVPRPDPPQYGPLWQNVHRFLNGLGSQERMTDLLGRLMVKQKLASRLLCHHMMRLPLLIYICTSFVQWDACVRLHHL